MIEWGNNWARAISYRRENDEAFAGFFSQIGRLYNVHHIWGMYNLKKSLDSVMTCYIDLCSLHGSAVTERDSRVCLEETRMG